MTCFLHFIHSLHCSVRQQNSWVTIFNTCCKHKFVTCHTPHPQPLSAGGERRKDYSYLLWILKTNTTYECFHSAFAACVRYNIGGGFMRMHTADVYNCAIIHMRYAKPAKQKY